MQIESLARRVLSSFTSHYLAWLCIICAGLRLISAAIEPFWYDETFTAWMVSLPLPRLLLATAGDVHPPLYYLVTWPLARIGNSEALLRLPALVFSTLAAVQLYKLVGEVSGDQRAARLAGVSFAVLPGQIYYGAEARMYSLMVLLVLTAMRATHNRRWLLFTASTGLLLYTQNLAAFYVVVLACYALLTDWRRAMPALMLAGLSWLPWLAVLTGQVQQVDRLFWVAPNANLGGALYWMQWVTYKWIPEWLVPHAFALAFGVTIIADWSSRSLMPRIWPLVAVSIIPPLLLYAASELWRPVMVERALLPSGAALIACWSIGFTRLSEVDRRALAALVLPMLAAVVGGYYGSVFYGPGRAELGHIRVIQAEGRAGDCLYHGNIGSLIHASYYLADWPRYMLPGPGDLAQWLSDESRTAMGIDEYEHEFDELRERGCRRVWLFETESAGRSREQTRAIAAIRERHHYTVEYSKATPILSFRLLLVDP